MNHRTVAQGIYEDQYGYEVRWRDGRSRSKRFPSDAPLVDLKAFRVRMQRQASDRGTAIGDGSFIRDVARFLRTRKGRSCYASDRAHFKPWLTRFRRRSRFHVTRDDVQPISISIAGCGTWIPPKATKARSSL